MFVLDGPIRAQWCPSRHFLYFKYNSLFFFIFHIYIINVNISYDIK